MKYEITIHYKKNDTNKSVPVYGIAFGDDIIPDICTEHDKLSHLVNLCNNGGLDPIHLMDVVEDFLNR